MGRKWNLCLSVMIVTVVGFALSACVPSEKTTKQDETVNQGEQMEMNSEDVLEEEQTSSDAVHLEDELSSDENHIGEHPDENFFEEDYSEGYYEEEFLEEEP